MAPEDVDWKDKGFTQEERKPTVHVTPENDYRSMDQGFEEAPIDLIRGTNEGYQAYDGPDTSLIVLIIFHGKLLVSARLNIP